MVELQNASVIALKALNIMQDTKFVRMKELEKEFSWGQFYFSGYNRDKPWFSKDVAYKIFASKSRPEQQCIVMNEDGTTYAINFEVVVTDIISLVNLTTGKVKDATNISLISNYLGGILFLAKKDNFVSYAVDRGVKKMVLNTLFMIYEDYINIQINNLERKTRYTKSEDKAFYFPLASYADPSTVVEYETIKAEYQKLVDELVGILKSAKELTLCYNNAASDGVEIQGSSNVVSNNYDQIVNCCGEVYEEKINKIIKDLPKEEAIKKIDDSIDSSGVDKDKANQIMNDIISRKEEEEAKAKQHKTFLIIVIIISCVVLFGSIGLGVVILNKRKGFSNGVGREKSIV